MMKLLAITVAASALTVGISTANAETCMIKGQIPVPCEGNAYAPAPVYGGPVYRAAPVYRAPVYSNYYYDDDYGYGPYDDDYYSSGYGGYPGAFYGGPSISFGFGFDGGHDGHRRWRHHRH